jgi:hypothetical protein
VEGGIVIDFNSGSESRMMLGDFDSGYNVIDFTNKYFAAERTLAP